ncbi:hypothetical protein C8R44DRAFT_859333 [Mycena epipterygia]|nr:hypothetical protein C8R44DRAFT_859333 [Mycena epipterygia]
MHLGFISLAFSIFATVVAQLPDKCDCAGTANTTDARYLCGDHRLGPVYLPSISPIGAGMLYKYDRFNGLCPGAFLSAWTFNGSYRFPEPMGFQLNNASKPIEGFETLVNGTLVDRFGATTGKFLAPAYTPFRQRSLTPESLNPPRSGPGPAADYHLYRVEKNFTVLTGTTAAWFGQPGQGTQYFLWNGTTEVKNYTVVTVPFTVADLLAKHILSEVKIREDD